MPVTNPEAAEIKRRVAFRKGVEVESGGQDMGRLHNRHGAVAPYGIPLTNVRLCETGRHMPPHAVRTISR